MKGYNSAEDVYTLKMNKALEKQLSELLEQKQLEIKLALASEAKKYEIRRKIALVPHPAGTCDISDECLQWFDDIVQAAAPDRPSTD